MEKKNSTLTAIKIFFVFLIMCCFSSCETKNINVTSTDIIISGRNVFTYVIDSCEYIGCLSSENADWCTHKGNCRFCAERARKNRITENGFCK